MISEDDIVEIVLDAIKSSDTIVKDFRKRIEQTDTRKGRWGFYASQTFNKPYTSLPAKKIFLSEYEIKQILRDGRKTLLKVPCSAIISPLAQEWLDEKGIKIVRED